MTVVGGVDRTSGPDRRALALAIEIGARALAKGNYGTDEGWRDWVDDARLVVLAVAPTLTRDRELRSCVVTATAVTVRCRTPNRR